MHTKSYLSPKTQTRKSAIHRRGLFAAQSIKRGEIVGIKGGHIIDWKTLKKHDKIIENSYLQIDDNFVLAPLNTKEACKVMMFLNHSCNPNVGVRGDIRFVAMRGIEPGEELTIDYAMIDNDQYIMKCRCGTLRCRGTITGKDWKRPELQKKYRGYFSTYIQDKIEMTKKSRYI